MISSITALLQRWIIRVHSWASIFNLQWQISKPCQVYRYQLKLKFWFRFFKKTGKYYIVSYICNKKCCDKIVFINMFEWRNNIGRSSCRKNWEVILRRTKTMRYGWLLLIKLCQKKNLVPHIQHYKLLLRHAQLRKF